MMDLQSLQAGLRLYRVECWEEAPADGKKYGRHHHVGVVSKSALQAVEVVREQHPTYRIDAVNPCGGVNYILANAPSADVPHDK